MGGGELGVEVVWNWNVAENKPPISRCVAWIEPFILVTGEVIPCCQGCEASQRDFQRKYSFGNVFEKSFREIWNSKE